MPVPNTVANVVEEYQTLSGTPDSRWRGYATWDQGFELLCVIVMALASLTAAWSGFQASSWSSSASVDQTHSSELRTTAVWASLEADVQLLKDMSLFSDWTTAYLNDDQTMMTFYRDRFSPELEAAMEEWLAGRPFATSDSTSSPFDLASYAPPAVKQADDLTAQADALAAGALTSLGHSDQYVMSTVILATVVFFGGLAAKLTWNPARLTAVTLAMLMLGWGCWEILRLPMHG